MTRQASRRAFRVTVAVGATVVVVSAAFLVATVVEDGAPPVQRPALTDPATPLGVQPSGGDGWGDPVMSEEFGDALTVVDDNRGLVGFRDGGPNWATWYPDWPRFTVQDPGGNHTNTDQAAYYGTSGVTVSGGRLRLACDQEESVPGLSHTAGMITSKDTFEPTYGWFEARIRLVGARSANHWPAWWMSNARTDLWPPEIDTWEVFGTDPEYLTNVYHDDGTPTDVHRNGLSDFGTWHTFGVEWTESGVTFHRDGRQTYSTAAPAGPMYLILNNGALSGASGAMPVVEVDYVRAWAPRPPATPPAPRSIGAN